MSIYERMGKMLSRSAGRFLVLVAIISVMMFLAATGISPGYEASSNPTGPAFEAREIVASQFPTATHAVPFIVEAKGEDVLTKDVLAEFYRNEEAFRQSEIYALYKFEGFDVFLKRPTTAIFTVADGVNQALQAVFGTSLKNATEGMVKVGLHFFFETAPGFLDALSKDNRTETTNITVGPITFPQVKVRHSKAFISLVFLDYEKVHGNFTNVLDLEGLNLDVVDYLKGEEESFAVYGIAIDLQTEIQEEAKTSVILVFIAAIAILIIAAISLRSRRMALLVGVTILMLLFWMFGSVRLLNFGSSQFIDLLLPIAILSLGVDYAIHSTHRYQEEKRGEPDPREAYRKSVARVGPALFIAMVTTAVAFFSNASSQLQAVQQFGIAAGLAIVWAYLLLGLALPAMRMLPEARRYRRESPGGKEEDSSSEEPRGEFTGSESPPRGRLEWLWVAIARIGTKPVLVIVVVALITIPLAYRGMGIEGKMPVEDFINSKSNFVKSLEKMNEHFVTGEEGKVLIQGDFSDPENLAAVERFHENLQDNKEAIYQKEILSIYDYVHSITVNDNVFPQYGGGTLRDHLGVEDGDGDGLPDAPEMVERIYEFIIEESQGVPLYLDGLTLVRHDRLSVEGIFRWHKGPALDIAQLTVRLPHSGDASKVAEGKEELEEDLAFLKGMGFAYDEVSDGAYYVITDVGTYNPFTREEELSALTQSMGKSVLISVGLCLIVMILLFRSAKIGIVAIIPMILVVAWLYGYMEMTGHYLNAVTVTIAAISIGVGVDYSIHVTQRFREEYGKTGEYVSAMQATLKSTGAALTASAGSTFVGFFIIGLSPMTMFSKFGFLTATMIAMAFTAAILVLPSFLRLTIARE